jgi:hypothetical protein
MDQSWGALADLSAADREAKMAQRYFELASLPDDQRVTRMAAMARAEYALPYEKLREFTMSRLRTWLKLDDKVAVPIVAAYDKAMLQMPSTSAMHRVALNQTLARQFNDTERERLSKLIPAGFGTFVQGLDRARVLAKPPEKVISKRGWLPFGKK